MKISLKNSRIYLLKLVLLFSPLDFFSFKIQSVDISFYKFFSLLFIGFSLLNLIKSKKLVIKYLFLGFIIYFLFSIFYGIMFFESIDQRYYFNIISFSLNFFTFFFSYHLITEILSSNDINRINLLKKNFNYVIRIWFIAILLSIPQVFLFLFNINLSFESLVEYAPENQGKIFGINLLRPNTFFGEPRDIATLIIPVFFLYKKINGKEINIFDWSLILLIGILTQSSTFIVVFMLSILLLNFRRYLTFLILIIFFLMLVIPNYEIISTIIPRLPDFFNADFFLPETFDKELTGQLGDLSFIFYINSFFTLENTFIQFLFGNGIGTSSTFLLNFINSIYNTELEIVNSRILLYTLLVDIGFIGITLFYFLLKNILNSKAFVISKKSKTLFKLFLLGSIFTGSYIFLILLNYLIVLNYKPN